MEEEHRVDGVQLELFARAVLEKAGCEVPSAEAVAWSLTEGSLRGVDSHGALFSSSHSVWAELWLRSPPPPSLHQAFDCSHTTLRYVSAVSGAAEWTWGLLSVAV
jgi:hypothetical protein